MDWRREALIAALMTDLVTMDLQMKGKTVVITGGNSGIGKETARGLAAMGAALVLVCRNRSKAEAAKRELAETTGNSDIELVIADLMVQRDVRRAAQELLGSKRRIDVLINNAGSHFTSSRRERGWNREDHGVELLLPVSSDQSPA